jgi:cytochrome c
LTVHIGMRSANSHWLLGLIVLVGIPGVRAQTAPTLPPPASTLATPQTGDALLHGNAARGKTLYQNCTSCHSIDENDIGPKHRGVVGRKAGTVSDYAYSPALKASGIVWDEAHLNLWLTNPSAMVPGTKMYFMLKDPQDRADVIAYLAELK